MSIFGKIDTPHGGITKHGASSVDFVNPRWFGAQPATDVNDYTTDATAGFQAALDTHLPVFIPHGFWNITNLTISGFAQALYSNGWVDTELRCTAETGNAITIDATDCSLRGFYLSGPGGRGTSVGIYMASGGILKDLFIDQFNIGVKSGSGGVIADNLIIDPCSAFCMYLDGAQTSNVSNFIFTPAPNAGGIYMAGACCQNMFHQGILYGNAPTAGMANAVAINGGFDNIFTSLNIKCFAGSGIALTSGAHNNTFSICLVRSNGFSHGDGIEIADGSFNKVLGCTIWDDAGAPTQRFGVSLGPTSHSNIVANSVLAPNVIAGLSDAGQDNQFLCNVIQ